MRRGAEIVANMNCQLMLEDTAKIKNWPLKGMRHGERAED